MKKILFGFIMFISLHLTTSFVCAAAPCDPNTQSCVEDGSSGWGFSDSVPSNGRGPSGGTMQLDNPLEKAGVSTPEALIGQIIKSVLGILGSIALAMFVYGGVMMMTAGVNAKNAQTGKDTLFWATVGLIVIFSAYAMVKFLLTSLGQ